MTLGEFDLIARYFSRPCRRRDVLLGVGDDAALLEVPAGQALVAATDTLVEGRHFLPGAPARSVGHQALAVNLSDLAAMGAEPAWALLSLSLPEASETWLQEFADGLYSLAGMHGVDLVGGDTVRGPLVVTIEVLGFVEVGSALKRSGARPGDLVFVSGWPGESAAGLELLSSGAATFASDDPLVRRHLFATPRLELGRALRGRASAAMDVSDGLLGDLRKLCAASGGGAGIDLDALPVSSRLASRFPRARCESFVLDGGDDYELLFTIAPDEAPQLVSALGASVELARIGEIRGGRGVQCLRAGVEVVVDGGGFDHFA
ncbi:MAG: thiamine-phosphate kinase [Gammaproteobacteria bacterium]|nr:thiamine-phosphate kinase [Gammaproteobacteria bacterium]